MHCYIYELSKEPIPEEERYSNSDLPDWFHGSISDGTYDIDAKERVSAIESLLGTLAGNCTYEDGKLQFTDNAKDRYFRGSFAEFKEAAALLSAASYGVFSGQEKSAEFAKAMVAMPIGSYRGFDMELSFSPFTGVYQLTMKGTLSHSVTLGSDIHGNITRIDNLLSGLSDSCENVKQKLAEEQRQMEMAKAELGKPFPQEEELAAKNKRLAELNALLNLDQKDSVILDGDDEPEQDTAAPSRRRSTPDMER